MLIYTEYQLISVPKDTVLYSDPSQKDFPHKCTKIHAFSYLKVQHETENGGGVQLLYGPST